MPRTLTMYQVDAFADRLFAGNPAAVLVLDDALGDDRMQAIAMENNLSETAFAVRNGGAYDLRWFTPTHEAAFCGHATLATAHVLATEYGAGGHMDFETGVGRLSVTPTDGGYEMSLPAFEPEEISPRPQWAAEFFGDTCTETFRNFENHYAVLRSETHVREFEPDLSALAETYDIDLCITAPGDEVDFVSRYFAPRAGIPEDPVTGSTHSTLVPYWAKRLGKSSLSARQVSRRGGALQTKLKGDRISLIGQAVTFMKAEICLPD